MTKEEFIQQCNECGKRVIDLVFQYPKEVAICVLPGVLASIISALNIPHEAEIAMLDSAIKDTKEESRDERETLQ